jgi:hypothetical protein
MTKSVGDFLTNYSIGLGAVALILFLPPMMAPAAARVGVTSATNGDPLGRPPGETERVLRIGIDVQANEVVTTKDNDRAHLLFLDGTSLTVGPNAQLTIDKFVYDPQGKVGDLSITATKGVFRLVGGKISKTNPITVNTPSSTIGIRGGITIFTVTATQTVSSFIFGDKLTVTAQGSTQIATRGGSTIVTTAGAAPAAPVLAGVGAFNAPLSALEGTSSSSSSGSGSTTTGPTTAAVDQAAKTFGSTQNTPPPAPPSGTGQTVVTNSNTQTQVVSNTNGGSNPQDNTQQSDQPTSTTTTTVIVTQGRFIADPSFTSFDPATRNAPHNPTNNQVLMPTGTQTTVTDAMGKVTQSTATITTNDGRSLILPWTPGKTFSFTGSGLSGTDSGYGLVSADESFFGYVLTNSSTGKQYGVFGGTPTPTSKFPTGGIQVYNMLNALNPGSVPFVPGPNPTVTAAANISPLYSIYAANPNQGSQALQMTIAIAGTGVGQRSYMGGFIGDYATDYTSNTIMNTGRYTGSYRANGTSQIDRLISSQVTAQTANGNAIYGANGPDAMVLVPDKAVNANGEGGATTTRTDQAAFEQPFTNLNGNPYVPVTIATRGTNPAGLGSSRTSQTVNGFVGGVIETRDESGQFSTRLLNVGAGDAHDVSITADASTNRAQGTIVVRNFGGNQGLGTPTATFELGSTTGDRRRDSAFIDDSAYAMSDRKNDVSRYSSVKAAGTLGPGTPITSNTILVSYQTAPLPGNLLPGGVTPCECAFLTWGWWSGDIAYTNPGFQQGERDRLHLATYVAGTLTNQLQLPNTGTATFNGHAIGNVVNGRAQYIAAGTYTNVWSFQTQTGQVTIGNFDGATYTGSAALTGGTVQFAGPLTGAGRTGALNGAFYSGPGNPVAGQAGNFSITGTGYKAGGTFASQKQP